jgi:large subunit ribosomal protein L28
MPRVCHFTGVRTITGNRIRTRGRAKYLGGVGTKVTSCTRRTFKPNLQTVTAVIDGKPKRVRVSARAIRQGLVVKPLKRKYAYTRKLQEQADA